MKTKGVEVDNLPQKARCVATEWVRSAGALLFLGLVIVGIGGVIYKAIIPSGWIATLWSAIWKQSLGSAFALTLGALAGLSIIVKWLGSGRAGSGHPEFIAYLWLALGIVFIFQWVASGGL
ncbi:MAG: hypothetical protein ACREUA_00850 [Burkholderiales bacterium]